MRRLLRLAPAFLSVLLTSSVVLSCAPSASPPLPAPAPAPTPAPAPKAFTWPSTLSIMSATGVGQAQWVSITSQIQKDTGSRVLVVAEGAPALRFKAVQQGEAFATGGGSGDFQNVIEAGLTFAREEGGPFQVRMVWPFGIAFSGFIVRKDSGIKSPSDLKPGMKFGDLTISPVVRTGMMAGLLAWANIPMDKVTFVPFGAYDPMVAAVKEGKIDVSFVFTSSPKVLEVADETMMIPLDATKEPAGAQRFLAAAPPTNFIKVLDGPPSFVGTMSMGGITAIATREASDPELVYNLAKWLDTKLDMFKDGHPMNKYMTMDNMATLAATAFVPVHPGTIKYLKEKGKWSAKNDDRQAQAVAFVAKWVAGYQDAMKAAKAKGLTIDPSNKDWVAFWDKYKVDNKLPPCAMYLGL